MQPREPRTSKPLRVIFAGTPDFARVALEHIHAAGHDVVLVLTQPDRPAGRGMKLQASAVKQCALGLSIPVAQPRSLRLDGKFPDDARAAQLAIAEARADVMVVAAYGLILPQWVLDAMQGPAQWGCLNIHGSLLPRWRGAAPIHRAIEAGDAQTGVTIMQMDAGLDTGDMLLRAAVDIRPVDTTTALHDTLADLGARLVVQALELAPQGQLQREPQPTEGITYAHKIEKHEAWVNWTLPAQDIARKVRAFNPFPGCASTLAGESIKVWQAQVCAEPTSAAPGTVLEVTPEALVVATGEQALAVTELQRPGGRRMRVAEFIRGFAVQAGMQFAGDATPPSTV